MSLLLRCNATYGRDTDGNLGYIWSNQHLSFHLSPVFCCIACWSKCRKRYIIFKSGWPVTQEELYNHLTSQVKSRILESIRGAGTQKDFNIHNLVCGVRRKLSLRGQTSGAQKCALKWWKKVSDDIYSSLDYLVHWEGHWSHEIITHRIKEHCGYAPAQFVEIWSLI